MNLGKSVWFLKAVMLSLLRNLSLELVIDTTMFPLTGEVLFVVSS
jgi:hypothetical protein